MGRASPRSRLQLAVAVFALLLILGLLAAGWYVSDLLTRPPDYYPYGPNNQTIAVDGDQVTLAAGTGSSLPGSRWGLRSDAGYVQMDELVRRDQGEVTWRVGGPPDQRPPAGADVRVDEYVFVGDPLAALDLPFEEVLLDGPLGSQPAWLVAADGDAVGTVVYVHGHGGSREEANRFLPALVDAGWDVLVPTYRGDEGAPPLPEGRVLFGTTEWADIETAVAFADQRPGPLVLWGSSMGGAVVAQLLDRSQLAREVDAVVMDSPLLSLDAMLEVQAGHNGIPEVLGPVLLPTAQLVADLRFGLDSAALEQVAGDSTFRVPTLVFHGALDADMPIAPARELAGAGADVHLEVVPDAGHLRSWNVDPQRYERVLIAFLADVR